MENNSPHLSFEQITDYALGASLGEQMAEHLKSCPQCEIEFANARQLIEVMRQDATEDAPPFAIAAILRSFDEQKTANQTAPKLSVGQRVRAILRLDSARLAPAYGFRSAYAANSRQLLFSADEGSLDVRISPLDTKWIVSGQVLGQITGGTVELQGGSINFQTDVDASCEFKLPPIPSGTYRLRLHSEKFDVEVPDLVIG